MATVIVLSLCSGVLCEGFSDRYVIEHSDPDLVVRGTSDHESNVRSTECRLWAVAYPSPRHSVERTLDS